MQNDMMSSIRAVVAEEVGKTLGRQVELLEQIAQYLGVPVASRAVVVPASKRVTPAPARQRQEAAKPAAKKRGRPRAVAKETSTAAAVEVSSTPFKQGQEVRYKQGRGTFPAVVKAIDVDAGTVTLERQSDGKQVERPYAKVETA
ncbi:PspA [Myxococcus xanthus]|uniref:PspA n=1 Tax=Myxococcus xanthus TaxID=34 RepID=A0A7Y4IMZ8_MYXXA|nr:PspA [Myxococcus xanthus]NOJ81595.1 PspA [Myxococcus xanthus]NOJ89049.1 PspA [Myxococcus xanthus]